MAIYGDEKHTSKETEMTLYCLMDMDGDSAGMISTTAPKKVIEELWKYVQDPDGYTEEEAQYIQQEKGSVDGYDIEELVLLLELRNTYETERVWYTEIYT